MTTSINVFDVKIVVVSDNIDIDGTFVGDIKIHDMDNKKVLELALFSMSPRKINCEVQNGKLE